jgi:hypothetical protein
MLILMHTTLFRGHYEYLEYTGVPELPHDILIAYSGVKIKTKIERKNVEGRIVSIP